MPRTLNYTDAVRILGGGDSATITALDRISRGLMLGAAPTVGAVLGWLDARVEFVRLCHDLVRGVSERRSGLDRLDRTQRLTAAHTVIVVTAYFEALAEAPLPFALEDVATTRAEQLALAGGQLPARDFVSGVRATEVAVPPPHGSHEEYEDALGRYYGELSERLRTFVAGLSIRDRVSQTQWDRFTHALSEIRSDALGRHGELMRALCGDFPEVAHWVGLREHRATREEIRTLDPSLRRMATLLDEIASDRAPDDRRAALVRAHQAWLIRPILPSGDLPAGIRVPTLDAAYVPPSFRVLEPGTTTDAGNEALWHGVDPREDFDGFLAGYLTSPVATEAPLLVLGQPGAGKSVLSRVLAARLPPTDFLPVLVSLREVAATTDVQDQIEQAVRAATSERIDWPDLARSADGALPVVLLDGFDELLQATGVSQSDYLERVAEFQRRESEQGRAVAVVVTSRVSVAGRARTPVGTVLLRLEPFDRRRIEAWLLPWNAANSDHFDDHDLRPLDATTVCRYPDLAGQPLLLLMLALYDADGNALQRLEAGPLSLGDLYERLLRRFAAREVTKHRADLAGSALDRATDEELRRLSVVAFAMFNRSSQWVTQDDLERDLTALLGAPAAAPVGTRARLGQAEVVLGRFFFVHRAQAVRDDAVVGTYEFLHSTFGEYLVARLTWQVLGDAVARAGATTLSFGPTDHSLLHALLSFATLTVRTATVPFLRGMAAALDATARTAHTDLMLRLFTTAGHPPRHDAVAAYEPRRLTAAARQAQYSANLLVLILVTGETVDAGRLFPGSRAPVEAWHDECLLWHSQLDDEEWDSLLQSLTVERIGAPTGPPGADTRDVRVRLGDGTAQVPPPDPFWSWNITSPPYGAFTSSESLDYFLRRSHIQCGGRDDEVALALLPLARSTLAPAAVTFAGWLGPPHQSVAQALLEVWLLPVRHDLTPAEREDTYRRCAVIVSCNYAPWSSQTRAAAMTLLVHALMRDDAAPVTDVLTELATATPPPESSVTTLMMRCGQQALARTPTESPEYTRLTDLLGGISL
ncbi:hypothetical protein Val02_82530 [Virgisporangium aliadipatigenens]|uniref:NACHT N-terminal Helical domain-containing protein n=1 Tax=Virgisporangium aliadipatigenens TaxID=741659 RepID=A0A8J3YVQ3_9ACTN|nr:hypothetical protein [Virgisporangium aliadipatigenens]GIJ51367.1 hypothetical protein Val02_82530 [Virgisporangium aliadipatigenens]